MKYTLLIVTLSFLMLTCGQNNEKKHVELNDNAIVNDSIVFVKTKLKEIKFVGTPSLEEGIKRYKYLGYNEKIEYHAVEGSYWEESEVYLIDNKTVKIDTIWSNPVYSPNDSLIVCKSMEYGLEGVPNGFQIWKLSHYRTWNKIKEINQQEWVPREITWLDNERIKIKITPIELYYENGMPTEKIFRHKIFKAE